VAATRLAAREKGAHRSGRVLAFVDETGHSFRARAGRSWAPRGHPPVLRRLTRQHGRREVSSIVALIAPHGYDHGDRPRLYARHFRGAIGGAQVAQALRYFRHRVGRPLTVVWDRLNAHRAATARALASSHPTDYHLEWLPPYAPDLNPEELCNGAVKRATQNALPESVDALHRLARDAFRRLGRNPHALAGFLRHTRVPVTRPT
jgi:transposase